MLEKLVQMKASLSLGHSKFCPWLLKQEMDVSIGSHFHSNTAPISLCTRMFEIRPQMVIIISKRNKSYILFWRTQYNVERSLLCIFQRENSYMFSELTKNLKCVCLLYWLGLIFHLTDVITSIVHVKVADLKVYSWKYLYMYATVSLFKMLHLDCAPVGTSSHPFWSYWGQHW